MPLCRRAIHRTPPPVIPACAAIHPRSVIPAQGDLCITRHSRESMSRTPIRGGNPHPLSIALRWRGGRGVRTAPCGQPSYPSLHPENPDADKNPTLFGDRRVGCNDGGPRGRRPGVWHYREQHRPACSALVLRVLLAWDRARIHHLIVQGAGRLSCSAVAGQRVSCLTVCSVTFRSSTSSCSR